MSGNIQGFYGKYKVIRKATGEEIDGFFLLRVATDKAAWDAAMLYSYLTHNPRLGKELRKWLNDMRLKELQELSKEEKENKEI